MSDRPKKRIYSEDYEDFQSKNSSSRKKSEPQFNGEITPNKQAPKSDNIIDKAERAGAKVQNVADKTTRTFDKLFSADYKDYKIQKNGRDNLSQFTDKELKFIKRDNRIEGMDNSAVKAEVKSRKIDVKAIAKDAQVNTIYNIKTDKGNVSIGLNKKTGELQISDSNYKGNPNVKNWRTLKEGDVGKALSKKGDIKEVSLQNDSNKFKGINAIPKDKLVRMDKEVYKGLDNSHAKNSVIKLDSKALENPEALKGKIIEDRSGERHKVLAADSKNLTVQPITGKDNATIINVKTEKNKSTALDTQITGIIDKKTVMGYNDKTGQTVMGKVNADKSVEWKTQAAYLQGLKPENRAKVEQKLENGDFRLNKTQPIGRAEGGNIVYAAEKADGKKVVTADQNKWVDAASQVGVALLAAAGVPGAKELGTIMDVKEVFSLATSNKDSFKGNSVEEANGRKDPTKDPNYVQVPANGLGDAAYQLKNPGQQQNQPAQQQQKEPAQQQQNQITR